MEKVWLFCLPFAGGNKYSYRMFERFVPSFIEITTLEYPGRGSRINEELLMGAEELVDDAFQQIAGKIKNNRYCIYGHSMGALLASSLTRKILETRDFRPPLHLFVSGTSAPSAPSRGEKKRHQMAKQDFLNEIISLGGGFEMVSGNAEFVEYFEPILRADFKASENFVYSQSKPMDIPLTVMTGSKEELEAEDISLWQAESKYKVEFRSFPGDHFFILDHPYRIMKIISRRVYEKVKIKSL